MQIWRYRQRCLRPLQGPAALLDALVGEGENALVAFVGAGGKSTLMHALGVQAARSGRHVLLGTTTHIRRPRDGVVLTQDDAENVAAACRAHRFVTVGRPCADGKLAMTPGLSWKQVRRRVALTLLEADGAKGRPIKAPRVHEPVVPPQTTHVCAVVGLSALGRTIEQAGFGIEPMCRLLGKPPQARIEPMDIARLCVRRTGARKHVPAQARYCVCLHQADTPGRLAAAGQIAAALQKRGVRCLITAGGEGEKPCAL